MQKVYTRIESIVGNVVTVRAPGVKNGDLALVGDSYANVIKLDKDIVSLQVFAGAQGVSTTDPVRFLLRPPARTYLRRRRSSERQRTGSDREHDPYRRSVLQPGKAYPS